MFEVNSRACKDLGLGFRVLGLGLKDYMSSCQCWPSSGTLDSGHRGPSCSLV